MDEHLQTTALTGHHVAAGARLAPFAGWSMPLRFEGTLAEHAAVRAEVGAFDVSHLGTVWIEGAQAAEVVAATFTNDPARLEDGTSQYTLCCDEQGGIVDDLILYRVSRRRFVAVPNAANTAAVTASLEAEAADRAATVLDASSEWAVLAVQGPRALAVTDQVLIALGAAGSPAAMTPAFGVRHVELAGGALLLCRTGYTGERGVELLVPDALALAVWEALSSAGVTACGLAARDTLRLEMGYPLHGNELSPSRHPYEARLGWAVRLDRDAFRGRQALVAAKATGPSERLWGLVAAGRRPARAGLEVLRVGTDEVVGTTTSGSLSPTLGVPIALAYLEASFGPGDRVELDVRGHRTDADVVRPPFVERDPKA
ncbi:MAG: glycine cleavage system aminomethyltransferase GcvT [Nitriliruptoraceae bacterium]